jgi:peroxiredoxin
MRNIERIAQNARLAVIFAAGVALACLPGAQTMAQGSGQDKGAGLPERTDPSAVKSEFPAFTLPDLDARSVDLSALLSGKVGLVTFWASWCQPCIAEIPALRVVNAQFQTQGLIVLGIGLKQGGDTAPKQRQAAMRNMMDYNLVFDEKDLYQTAFQITSLPLNLLVDATGKIRWRGPGLPEDLRSRVMELLKERREE